MICLKYKITLIILLLIGNYNLVTAIDDSNIQAAFLDIGIGARAMGLGGAYSSLAKGSESSVWNPAGLVEQQLKHSSTFENVTMLDLYNYNHLSYSYLSSELYGFGLAALYSGGDEMSETTLYLTSAINLEYFKDFNSLPAKLRMWLYQFNFGINLKYFHSSFGNNKDGEYMQDDTQMQNQGSADGYGVDIGLKFSLNEANTLSFMGRNLLANISWDTSRSKGEYTEDLPAGMIFGYNFTKEYFLLSFDYDKSLHGDTEDYISLGAEYLLLDKTIAIRSGYSQELLTGNNKHYGFGLGYSLKDWYNKIITIDVSYEINTSWKKHNNLRFSLKLDM